MGKADKAAKAAKVVVEKNGDVEDEKSSYEQQVKFCAIIAKPLAEEKLCKKVLKLAKKASKRKAIKRGVKEVVKAIRKNVKGICLLAGDISPIDVLTHIPIVCEDHGIPYIYVPSKEDLGSAALSKRPTSCLLVLPQPPKGPVDAAEQEEFSTQYEEVSKKITAVKPVW